MICPACTAEAPDENLYCETCGERLRALPEAQPGCTCGPEASEVDEDGFCEGCGKRVRRPASDHLEEAPSTALAAVSDRGLRHERNEDRFALSQTEAYTLVVLCDGVSSTRDAEGASGAVAEGVARYVAEALASEGTQDGEALLSAAIRSAGAELRAKAGEAPAGNEPSTTVVAALLQELRLTVAWMGDSRAYWHDTQGTRQLTSDHSWLQEVLREGTVSADEAQRSPQAHAITRWVGADADPDWASQTITEEISNPGLLLLCSDGLWNYYPDSSGMDQLLQEIGATNADALASARALVTAAIARGGQDNVTVALLQVGPQPLKERVLQGEPTPTVFRTEV